MGFLSARVRGWWPVLDRVIDPAIAVLVTGLGLISVLLVPQSIGTMPPALATVLALATGVLIAVRRRWPVAVLVATAAVLLLAQVYATSLNFGGFALLIAVFTVATETPRRISLVALAALPAYLLVAVLIFNSAHPSPTQTVVADLITAIAIYGTAWLVGASLRTRRDRTAALEARADRLEREQAEAARIAVANERAQIARELHDVVAHSVSVMVIQAGAARRIVDEQPVEARIALESIETTGREALAELRRLLGIIRAEDGRAPLAPQQGVANLGQLLGNARPAGVVAELVIEGEQRPLAPGIDLAVYRIAQEGLTNVIKHAAPARATVLLCFEPEAVVVEVRDDGRGDATMGSGAGHGLVGMEERVRVYGGTFSAGRLPDGGFAIRARIPTNEAR